MIGLLSPALDARTERAESPRTEAAELPAKERYHNEHSVSQAVDGLCRAVVA